VWQLSGFIHKRGRSFLLKGIVVGQGDTYEAALIDVKSAIKFHIDTFGAEDFEMDTPVIEVYIAEAGV
jgi:predicted RNase H-like HicB family nuclease